MVSIIIIISDDNLEITKTHIIQVTPIVYSFHVLCIEG